MLAEDWRGMSVLYVCPIKALLNNLVPRLKSLATLLGRRVEVWHGDVGESARKAIRKDPPDLLLTTPESIESLLVSRKSIPEEFFRDVRAVIVDEVHAFAGDDRGWHLLAVLSRLEAITERSIQRIGLSATVGNPDEILSWLSLEGRPGRVLNPPAEVATSETEIHLDFVRTPENAAKVIAQLHRGEKRLVFVDSRAGVEGLAGELRGLGVQTFVSHSSLGVQERRDAERAFQDGKDCVIVATSTLELGIDVGDLDRVIQLNCPPTVAGFLQRLGRTGRRKGTVRNCLFLATKADALVRAAALIRLWRKGFVEPVVPPPEPLHVLAQQLMALALQKRGLSRAEWRTPTSLFLAASRLSQDDGQALIDHMLESDLLNEDGGLLWFGQRGEEKFGFRHFMELMVIFTSEPLLTVRHGRLEVGQVDPLAILRRKEGLPLQLAGRSWGILEVDWDRKRIQVQPTEGRGKVQWMGDAAPLGIELAQEYREILCGEALDIEWSKRASAEVENLRENFGFLRSGKTTLRIEPNGVQTWWTFGGLLANVQLANWIEGRFGTKAEPDNYCLKLERPIEPSAFREALMELREHGEVEFSPDIKLAERLKFRECLPTSLLAREMEARYAGRREVEAVMHSELITVVG
jgi:ATP-dependent Lhr-like helicase